MSRRLTKRYLTPSDKYECSLSTETQAIAEEQLRETENSRSQALEALRNWLEQSPKFLAIRMGAYSLYIKPKHYLSTYIQTYQYELTQCIYKAYTI